MFETGMMHDDYTVSHTNSTIFSDADICVKHYTLRFWHCAESGTVQTRLKI